MTIINIITEVILAISLAVAIRGYYRYQKLIISNKYDDLSRMKKDIKIAKADLYKKQTSLIDKSESIAEAEKKIAIDVKMIEDFYSENSYTRRLAKRKAFEYVSQMPFGNISDKFMANLFESFIDDAKAELCGDELITVSKRTINKKTLWKTME